MSMNAIIGYKESSALQRTALHQWNVLDHHGYK